MRRIVAQFLLVWLIAYSGFAFAFPIVVTDVLARQVTIKVSPQRIVSLAPSNTEQLFAIGAGDRVVGVTLYDNYPPQVQTLERVGGYVDKSISVEKIISLRPDLVLSRGVIQKGVITALERVGIAVVASEPKNFDEVYESIALMGRLTDRVQQAAQVVADMRQRVARIHRKVAAIPLMLLVLTGCPSTMPNDGISNSLREACPLFSDVEIEAGLVGIELDRENGISKTEELAAFLISCETPSEEAQFACNVCVTLLVDEVYDR